MSVDTPEGYWLHEGGHHVAVMFGRTQIERVSVSIIEAENDEIRAVCREFVAILAKRGRLVRF